MYRVRKEKTRHLHHMQLHMHIQLIQVMYIILTLILKLRCSLICLVFIFLCLSDGLIPTYLPPKNLEGAALWKHRLSWPRCKKKKKGSGTAGVVGCCRSSAISSLQVSNPTAFIMYIITGGPTVCVCVRPPSSTVCCLTRGAIKADQTDCDVEHRSAYMAPCECKVHYWTGAAPLAVLTRRDSGRKDWVPSYLLFILP